MIEFAIVAYPIGFALTWLAVYPADGYGAQVAWIKSAFWFVYLPAVFVWKGLST